jgi:hypothetical protein
MTASIKNNFGVKSQLAKLLATENITIRHNPAFKTAAFDLKNRVLTLPVWQGISDDLYDMLVVHEVGHALDTPMAQWEAAINGISSESYKVPKKGICKGNKRVVKDFLNVVEDARIDKRQKRRYPGSKYNYSAGYKELFDRDLFDIKGKDISKLPLIDRLNLHYKVPVSCLSVPFSKEERQYVDLIDKAETFQDVVDIVGAVYKYAMEEEQQQERKKTDQYSSDGEGEEGDGDEGDESSDGDEGQEGSNKAGKSKKKSQNKGNDKAKSNGQPKDEADDKGEKGNEDKNDKGNDKGDDEDKSDSEDEADDKTDSQDNGDEPQGGSDAVDSPGAQALTMKSFEENMSGILSKDRTNYIYINSPEIETKNVVEDWKQFLPIMEGCFPQSGKYGHRNGDLTAHIAKLNKWKKEEEKTLGFMIKEFEMRKAADEYARTSIAKTGVIDTNKLFSYMYNDDVFRRQAVVTTGKNHGFFMILDWSGSMSELINDTLKQMFSLVMFCKRMHIPFEVYIFRSWSQYGVVKNANESVSFTGFKLSNILSSRMNFKTFNRAMELIWCANKVKYSQVPMGGTPLNGSIMAADKLVLDFKKKNKLQIVNTIILTDGASDSVFFSQVSRYNNTPNKVIMTDTVTKKNYEMDASNQLAITRDFLHMLRDRTGCNLIGFFLSDSSNLGYQYWLTADQKKDPSFAESWKKNNFVGVTTAGYDEYYIINVPAMGRDSSNQKITGESIYNITSSFIEGNTKKKVNRVLLSKFIARIAKDDPVKKRVA